MVPDRLAAAGWEVQVAHARKLRDVAPPACKTDEVERVVAELCRRDLVPALWSPSLDDRALRERLRLASLSPEEAGVNLAAITVQLERGGVRSFATPTTTCSTASRPSASRHPPPSVVGQHAEGR